LLPLLVVLLLLLCCETVLLSHHFFSYTYPIRLYRHQFYAAVFTKRSNRVRIYSDYHVASWARRPALTEVQTTTPHDPTRASDIMKMKHSLIRPSARSLYYYYYSVYDPTDLHLHAVRVHSERGSGDCVAQYDLQPTILQHGTGLLGPAAPWVRVVGDDARDNFGGPGFGARGAGRPGFGHCRLCLVPVNVGHDHVVDLLLDQSLRPSAGQILGPGRRPGRRRGPARSTALPIGPAARPGRGVAPPVQDFEGIVLEPV
jgi:hypothetical protein